MEANPTIPDYEWPGMNMNITYEAPLSYQLIVFTSKFAISIGFLIIIPCFLILCIGCCSKHKESQLSVNKYCDIYKTEVTDLRNMTNYKKSNIIRRNKITSITSRKQYINIQNPNNINDEDSNDLEKQVMNPNKKYIVYKFDTMNDSNDPLNRFIEFLDIIERTYNADYIELIIIISCPGGIAYQYKMLYTALMQLKNQGYRITISTDDVCASGGYMLACAGNKIIASKYAMIGSIGCYTKQYNLGELAKKVGVEEIIFKQGQYKGSFPLLGPYTESDKQNIQDQVDIEQVIFSAIVKENRNLTDEQIAVVTNGKVFTAQEALDLQLIDEIKTSHNYLNAIAEHSEDIYICEYKSRSQSIFGSLFNTTKKYVSAVLSHMMG